MTSSVVPHWAGRKKRVVRTWSPEDRERLAELWTEGVPMRELEDQFERDSGSIYAKVSQMGLPPRRGRKKTSRKRLPAHGGTNRRFVGVENPKGPKIELEPHHPAVRKGTTFFPSTVIPASQEPRMLKSGVNSRKIGGTVKKGKWKGFPIFTLTLEERDTCPRSCKEFTTCYGNNMPFARRILDDGTLTKRLWGELAAISAENKAGFVVRLHVLGDFNSIAYVEFWRQALIDFPALHIFGFTARIPPDPIGIALVRVAAEQYERFRMRFSGAGHETDCSEVVDKPEDATGVRCPAETDPNRYCGSCGLCWHSNVTISFVRH